MAKAITEIAIGAAAIGASFIVPGSGILIGSLLLTHAAVVGALVSIASTEIMAGAMDALKGNQGGIAVGVTTPIGAWSYLYGTQKVGGIKIFEESNNNTGGGGSTSNNKQLHRVYAIACHPCALGSWQLRIDGAQVLMAPDGAGFLSYSPTQLKPIITSISRTDGVVTMKLASGIPNQDGLNLLIRNVVDNTFNGTWIVTQPNPLDDTTFTYICGGPDKVTSGGYATTTYADYKDKIYVQWLDGNHTSTFSTLLAAGTNWGPSDLCLGRTLVYIQMGYDESVFPSSIPNVSFVLDGKNDILDPRTGTRGFTKNAALCVADYMALPRIAGGFGLTIGTNIPSAPLVAAANICDEAVPLAGGGTTPRYTCNTFFQLSSGRGSTLKDMLTSCAGRISFQGGLYSIFPGAWLSPTLQLTDADLVGKIDWRPRLSIRDTANSVKGTYVSPENAYQQGDVPPYMEDVAHGFVSDQYLAEDNGERIFKEANFPCTDSSAIAQRLEKIELLRTRFQGRGTIRCTMRAYQVIALDVIQLTHARYGWVNKNFEVLSSRFTQEKVNDVPALAVELDIAETGASIFDWSTAEQLTPQGYKYPTNAGTSIVSDPEALSLYSGPGATIGGITYPDTVSVGSDGIKRNSLYVLWTPPNDTFVVSGGQIEVQWKLHGTTLWNPGGKFSGASSNCFINNVTDTIAYDVRIRSINVGGYPSDWVEQDNFTVSSVTSSISVANITGLSGSALGDASSLSTGTVPAARLPTALIRLNAAGASGSTVVPGATAQVGTGATATASGSALSGAITLTTGTGTLAGGVICVLTFPSTLSVAPEGVCAMNGNALIDLEWVATTTDLTLSVLSPLAPSTTYKIGYSMS